MELQTLEQFKTKFMGDIIVMGNVICMGGTEV